VQCWAAVVQLAEYCIPVAGVDHTLLTGWWDGEALAGPQETPPLIYCSNSLFRNGIYRLAWSYWVFRGKVRADVGCQ
jgi:hypothetical protein